MGNRLQGVHRNRERVEDDARRGSGRIQRPANEEQPDAAEDHADGGGGAGVVHVRGTHANAPRTQIKSKTFNDGHANH